MDELIKYLTQEIQSLKEKIKELEAQKQIEIENFESIIFGYEMKLLELNHSYDFKCLIEEYDNEQGLLKSGRYYINILRNAICSYGLDKVENYFFNRHCELKKEENADE